MDIQELQGIETARGVVFSLKPNERIGIKGKSAAVDEALKAIEGHRDEVAELLRRRQAADEQEVEREVVANVPSLGVQRANYVRWAVAHGKYYTPSDDELDAMFAACSEGDEILPDFAFSFTVRKPNGLLVAVDRKGCVSQPSPYSPVLTQK